MILHVLRALFVLLMAAVGFFFAFQPQPPLDLDISVVIAIAFAGLLVCIDILASGIIDSQLIVPQFVLNELQQIADSGDKLKRNRGRRGLDVLAKLRNSARTDVAIYDPHGEDDETAGVDQRLMNLAKELNG